MGSENVTSMVGVYRDFENIHASLFERAHGRDTWRDQRNQKAEWVVDVKAVMSFVASIGTVAINRAYNNWQYFASYRHDFHEHSIKITPVLLLKGRTSRLGPGPGEELTEGDVLVVIGKSEDIARLDDAGTA